MKDVQASSFTFPTKMYPADQWIELRQLKPLGPLVNEHVLIFKNLWSKLIVLRKLLLQSNMMVFLQFLFYTYDEWITAAYICRIVIYICIGKILIYVGLA